MALAPMNELRKRVAAAMQTFPEVKAVFLFGSMAEGRAKPESDVDLAVISDAPNIPTRRLDLLASLVKVGLDNVDLVFPDGRDVVLRYEAIRLNNLIYAHQDFDRGP